eukprot:3045569-Pleurochrysis_carterae.AAC.2
MELCPSSINQVVDIRGDSRICKRVASDEYEYRISTDQELELSDAQDDTIVDTCTYREFTVLELLLASAHREGAVQHIVDFASAPYEFHTLFAEEAALCSLSPCINFFKSSEIRRCAVVVDILSAILHLQTHAPHYTVVHGDIKPANIGVFVDEDTRIRLKLIDFGSAEKRRITSPLKRAEYLGSPNYMNRTLFERNMISRCSRTALAVEDMV